MIAKIKRGRTIAPKEPRNVRLSGFTLTQREAALLAQYQEKLNYTIGDFIRHALNNLQEQDQNTNDASNSEQEANLAQA